MMREGDVVIEGLGFGEVREVWDGREKAEEHDIDRSRDNAH